MRRWVPIILAPLLVAGADEKCPDEMVRVPGSRSCIDRFEFPNSRGELPYVGISGLPDAPKRDLPTPMDAVTLCSDTNSKRLCTRNEWVAACMMDDGWKRGDCNDSKRWRTPNEAKVARRDPKEMARLNQSEPSGAREKCVGKTGAHDMRGNVEEWVRCPGVGTGWCLMGRYWAEPVSCRYTVSHHRPRWHYYETGTRCCQDL